MHRRTLAQAVIGWFTLSISPASAKRRKRKKKPKTCVPGTAGPCTYDQCPLFVTMRMDAQLGANKATAWGADLKHSVITTCCGSSTLAPPSRAYQAAVVACVAGRGY